jgi:hypothetical protein
MQKVKNRVSELNQCAASKQQQQVAGSRTTLLRRPVDGG